MFCVYDVLVSRMSTSRAVFAWQVHGRPPALARCPRASVLCPFERGLRGLRMSDSRRLARPADDGACESTRSGQGLLAVAAASAGRQRQHHLTPNTSHVRASGMMRSHKCRASVCVRGWGEYAAYKRKGIIFACIFHDSIRRWNF